MRHVPPLVGKKVENPSPPPQTPRRGRPRKTELTNLLLQIAVGECHDINRNIETVKYYIYRVLRDELDARRRFIVRPLEHQLTRVWRME